MMQQLTCGQGHRWEVTHPDGLLACPVCGQRAVDDLGTWPVAPGAETKQIVEVPLQLPGFEVLGVLGQGGAGVVYRARQLSLDRVVAVKLLLPGAQAAPELLARFRVEAEAVARLSHPSIVQVHEVGSSAAGPFLVLEYVAGGTLAQQLAGRPQSARRAAEVVRTLAVAVQHAHAAGVLHRDLKPGNVLVAADGALKVSDFGLARRLDAGAGGPTLQGSIVGTPSYMAPEQASGVHQQLGPPTDVYALGAILYEMLTGRPPFAAENALETLLQVLRTDPVPPRRLNPSVPRDMEIVCLKCLDKTPARRYARAQELADDLGRFLDGLPVRARPAGPGVRLMKWARRRPAVAALLLVSVLGVVVGAAAVGWHLRQLKRLTDDLSEALEKEQAQQRRNTELLHRSVDTISAYGRFVDTHLPARAELRRELARRRLPFYEPFLREEADDPGLRERQAIALFEVGGIHVILEDHAQGERHLRESAALFEELWRAQPGDARHARQLARTLGMLGRTGFARRRPTAARRALARALELYDELARGGTQTEDDRADLASALGYLASTQTKIGQKEESLRLLRQQEKLLRHLLAQAPGRTDYRGLLGVALGEMGELALGQPDRQGEAAARLRESVGLLRAALRAEPANRFFMSALCWQCNLLGQDALRRQHADDLELAGTGLGEGIEARRPFEGHAQFSPPHGAQELVPAYVAAAGFLTRAAALSTPPAAERRAVQAVALLARAGAVVLPYEAGWRQQLTALDVRRHPAFAPLHDRADFLMLANQMAWARARARYPVGGWPVGVIGLLGAAGW